MTTQTATKYRRTAAQKAFSLERFRRNVAGQDCMVLETEWLGNKAPHRVVCNKGHECLAIPRRVETFRVICKKCRPGGFPADMPADLYLIADPARGALKVGIATKSSERILRWERAGWNVLATLRFEMGADASHVEAEVLGWLREDLGLPAHLTAEDMGVMHGWTETVDAGRVSPETIWARVLDVSDHLGR